MMRVERGRLRKNNKTDARRRDGTEGRRGGRFIAPGNQNTKDKMTGKQGALLSARVHNTRHMN